MKVGSSWVCIGLLLGTACRSVPEWQQVPHDRYFQRVREPELHPPLKAEPTSEAVFFTRYSLVRPIGQLVSPSTYVVEVDAGPEALDINAFDQVLDSTWYTNRIGRRPMSEEELIRGPNTSSGPAPGPLRVEQGKVEGVSPGFWVRDRAERRFIVKLDHPAYPGLSSRAELVATKILHAAGYNVPQNYLADLNLNELVVMDSATTAGRYGRKVPLTPQAVKAMLLNANPSVDGKVTALFSQIIEGRPVGPFSYRGQRSEDPNDRIPHERRRTLRGLGTFFAWINNTDSRASNSLDVWVEQEPGLGYLRHYLLDFGDALGASDTTPKYIAEGYENLVDLRYLAYGLLTFGVYYRWWLPVQRSPLRSVGTFESAVFDPKRWRPAIPNPAFQAGTARDRYWAAAIIARFTPEVVRTIVRSAQYPEPGAEDWIVRVLLERRRKILEHAFARVLPLDDLRVRGPVVGFTDLAVTTGLIDGARYSYRVLDPDGAEVRAGESDLPQVDLSREIAALPEPARPFLTVRMHRVGVPDPAVDLHLRIVDDTPLPVGLHRYVH